MGAPVCRSLPPGVVHKTILCEYKSDWFPMEMGIPQGSPLSPILFLFFIAELLVGLQQPKDGTLGFSFVNDTNLVAWGDSAQDNCHHLKVAVTVWLGLHTCHLSQKTIVLRTTLNMPNTTYMP